VTKKENPMSAQALAKDKLLNPQRTPTMPQPSVIHATAVIEKHYPKTVEQVFAAFSDPAKKRRWYADRSGNKVETFEMDFRIGGSETLAYRLGANSPFPGAMITNAETFQDIVPNRRIVTASAMSFDGRRFSASLVTFEFLPAGTGTELICTHQDAFFEGADGPELREKGWQDLLARLDEELLG
jgi:uncharacterized protein YndB with AHSA1/START domain